MNEWIASFLINILSDEMLEISSLFSIGGGKAAWLSAGFTIEAFQINFIYIWIPQIVLDSNEKGLNKEIL